MSLSLHLLPIYPQITAASTPFGRKVPLLTSLVLSGSALIPDVPEAKQHSNATNGKSGAGAGAGAGAGSHSSSALSLPSMRDPLFLQDSIEYAAADLAYHQFQELFLPLLPILDTKRYLQEEMLAAKCTEWGLIIATVLMNITVIISILRRAIKTNLWETYRYYFTR